jgi:hypothetical protein
VRVVAVAQENMLTLDTLHEEFEKLCEYPHMSNGPSQGPKEENWIAGITFHLHFHLLTSMSHVHNIK